jgi:hypothetical protein
MVETLHDLMIIKNEIIGMEKEIEEALRLTELDRKMRRLELLKKLYQAELAVCAKAGVVQEGDYRIINTGRTVRRVNVERLKKAGWYNLVEDYMSLSLKDAAQILEDHGIPAEELNSVCDTTKQDKYDIVDVMG